MHRWQPLFVAALIATAPLFTKCASGQSSSTSPAQTQSSAPAPAKLPAWDAVSIKPAPPESCTHGYGMRFTQDGVNIFCAPALFLIESAYGIYEPSRIIGMPEWTTKSNSVYDVNAKVTGEDAVIYGKLHWADKNRMLPQLLAERFHLSTHTEQREMAVYDLVVAKGGPKLKEAGTDEASKANVLRPNAGRAEGIDIPLDSFLWVLSSETGRPVVNKTGLTGKYDFTLEYVPAAKAATDETGGPSIFTALEEQLGLKLEPAKKMMDVLVIDSIEQPAAN